ncbi:MAG: hypothetical protein MI921_18300 [Cytophagales bacterium]|nr:hypothetical protein [Cytophagales bacterium]
MNNKAIWKISNKPLNKQEQEIFEVLNPVFEFESVTSPRLSPSSNPVEEISGLSIMINKADRCYIGI